MESKQKGGLIYFAGTSGFVLFCLALTAAKCVASELPSHLYLFPLILYVIWVIYLSGVEFGTRKPLLKRLIMILLSAAAACGLVWICLNVIVPTEKDALPVTVVAPESA